MPPERNKALAFLLAVTVVAGLFGVILHPTPAVGQAAEGDAGTESITHVVAPLLRVFEYLDAFYYRDISLPALVEGAIEGALRILDDPYTTFYKPSEFEDFQVDIEGVYTGIGMTIEGRDQYSVVQSTFPGSPAERAGIRPGDRIIEVDGKNVIGERPDAVARLIRGPEGTGVVLTLQRSTGETFEVRVVRERIQLQAVDVRVEAGDIGYIRIVQFYEGTGRQVQAAYNRLRALGVTGIVLDLRNNPGGLLNEAVAVGRVFVDEGIIVQVVDYSGNKQTYYGRGVSRTPKPPVAVLVNGGTASAAEIVAAAIRDNGLGQLVGSRTYGKGTVQSIFELGNGSALKLTTAEYLTPRGRSLANTGLIPDVPVEPVAPGSEAPAEPDFAPLSGRYVLQQGSRGLEVEGLQQRLNYVGFDAGAVDGHFGAKTAAALRSFQQAYGLPVTGRLDAQTHARLGEAVLARWRNDVRSESTPGVVPPQAGDADPVLAKAIELLKRGQIAAPAAGGS